MGLVYGARPLKRYLEKHVTTELSKLIIQMQLSPHAHVTIDTDANEQFQFHIKQLQRTTSNSPQKPAYNRSYRSTAIELLLRTLSFRSSNVRRAGRRTDDGRRLWRRVRQSIQQHRWEKWLFSGQSQTNEAIAARQSLNLYIQVSVHLFKLTD